MLLCLKIKIKKIKTQTFKGLRINVVKHLTLSEKEAFS
jgi:hypothetical protein